MLCVTRTYSADSLNWIEKRGYGKDTSAMVHHADRYAVSVRRGSCFIPVIRRLSRGLYLSQLLDSSVNHSKLFLRLLFDIQWISSRSKGKSSRKKEKGRGRWGPFHQVSSVAVTRPIFARFKAAFAAKPNIVHYSVFYLLSSHVIYQHNLCPVLKLA